MDRTDRQDPAETALVAIAQELYSLPAAEFTTTRNARARALRRDGDRDLAARVAALPRPSIAAWVLNQAARARAGGLGDLLAYGAQLREAHADLDAERIRALGASRVDRIREFVAVAVEVAGGLGQPVSEPVRAELESTLAAALADPAAAEAVRGGRLTRALVYAGFGEVELREAVAAPARLRVLAEPEAAEGGAAAEHAEKAAADLGRREREGRERERRARERREQEAAARAAVSEGVRRLTVLREQELGHLAQVERLRSAIAAAEAELDRARHRLAQWEAGESG